MFDALLPRSGVAYGIQVGSIQANAVPVAAHHDDGFMTSQIMVKAATDNLACDPGHSIATSRSIHIKRCAEKFTHRLEETPVLRAKTAGAVQRRRVERCFTLFDG